MEENTRDKKAFYSSYGVVWENLNDTQKLKFCSEQLTNIQRNANKILADDPIFELVYCIDGWCITSNSSSER